MNVLLDTCAALWLAVEPDKLSPHAEAVLKDGRTTCFLSSVSVWEIASKYGLGKLALPDPPQKLIPDLRATFGLTELSFDEAAAVFGGSLAFLHRDPFDRMLVCQALSQGLPILTPDAHIQAYPVTTIW